LYVTTLRRGGVPERDFTDEGCFHPRQLLIRAAANALGEKPPRRLCRLGRVAT
jgi:hypothetical protein